MIGAQLSRDMAWCIGRVAASVISSSEFDTRLIFFIPDA